MSKIESRIGFNMSHDDCQSDPEFQVIEKANEMLAPFIMSGVDTEGSNWKQQYKDELLKLIVICHENQIYPLPESVVELSRHLLGKTRGSVEPTRKFQVLMALAHEYDAPEEVGKLKRGTLSFAGKKLKELGGLRELQINTDNDYRQTVRPWLEDPSFIKDWKALRKRLLENETDKNFQELLSVVKKAARRK